jgi:hypothetical protein
MVDDQGPAAPVSATGPAGSHFEAKVAANAMLAMLRGAEPRGLPGKIFDRIAFQRAAEGHPLDDIVIQAHDQQGMDWILEIQVKRAITFSPKDETFRKVIEQISQAIIKPAFQTDRYELAIATDQATRAITGAYQDVLSQARRMESSASFSARMRRRGSASETMRTFIKTVRDNLIAAGAAGDDETVWRVLRRLQIHVYDFEAVGSTYETHARDRAADVLHSDERAKAGALWKLLVEQAIDLGAHGGATTRQQLIDDLNSNFRFAGDRRYPAIRAAIAEASNLALSDIGTAVQGISLERIGYVAAVRAACASGRFVLIQGDAGVGKSALLRKIAEDISAESRILVLSAGRVVERGWPAMKAQLGFEGTLPELLSDLASDGGGWIFIDNLDSYTSTERLTVIDIVRAASEVVGVTVVATARLRFGQDEASWIPNTEIQVLKAAPPVVIHELSDAEVQELRDAQPQLHALLANDHPARLVTRNLFRLSRLVIAPLEQPAPRSEVEMMRQWWRTADGDAGGRRERARLLRELATLCLSGAKVFNVSSYDATSIDALVKSETLQDLGSDLVAFRHDVIREWAIANVLESDAALLTVLPLQQNAHPVLMRGVELRARIALEETREPDQWRAILDSVRGPDKHPSWQRGALLALVHSELVEEVIPLMADTLLSDEAALLRVLIPIMMAVDVQPVRELYIAAGLDPSTLPETLQIPTGKGWHCLTSWILALGEKLPAKAMPEAVDLLEGWLIVEHLFPVPLSVEILAAFQRWLVEIEVSNDGEGWREHRSVFGGKLDRKQVERIEEITRAHLVLMANRAPKSAKNYLVAVQTLHRKADSYRKLMKFDGTLAQAAPEDLAAITLDALVRPPEDDRQSRHDRWDNDALTDIDHQFVPASPAQGPFFNLLVHAPAIGLKLINDLILKAVNFHTDGKAPTNDDTLVIETESGPRRLSWIRTYGWARASNYFSITSALMALEAWAHMRIEKGEPPEAVIADLIGAQDVPVAYALVVVDILLSHWPKTANAAVPYVACPELLCLDLSRSAHEHINENIKLPDIFGLNKLENEPISGPRIETLRSRASRRSSLDQLLGNYAVNSAWEKERDRATALLQKAIVRLGPIQPDDDRGDPRLMAVHAINLLDPSNYKDVELETADGNKVIGSQYVSPLAEANHFAPLHEKATAQGAAVNAALLVNKLVDHQERSSTDFAAALVAWAQADRGEDEDVDAREQAVVGAALIAMRDGSAELRTAQRQWAETVFARATKSEKDQLGARFRSGMAFNPFAMTFAGRVFALVGEKPSHADFERLFMMAAGEPAAAHGAAASASALRDLDERLPRSLLRIALAACIHVRHAWDVPEAENEAANAARQASLKERIDAELAWLNEGADEPAWAGFPVKNVRKKQKLSIRIGGRSNPPPPPRAERNEFIDHQSAALWLRSLRQPGISELSWQRDLYNAYVTWTFAANGVGLEQDEDLVQRPTEWNKIFFELMANCAPGCSLADINASIAPILDLNDQAFFDVSADFLRSLDAVYYDGKGLSAEVAATIRAQFAERLGQSYSYQRLRGTKSDGIETHLGPAIATQFFNDHYWGQAPKCYLFEKAIEPSTVFIASLQTLAVKAPSPFVAICVLNWLEISPRLPQLPLLIAFATTAIDAYPDDRAFWIDHGIGRRICRWLDKMREIHPAQFSVSTQHRDATDKILAHLVALGVVEARRLEITLSKQA